MTLTPSHWLTTSKLFTNDLGSLILPVQLASQQIKINQITVDTVLTCLLEKEDCKFHEGRNYGSHNNVEAGKHVDADRILPGFKSWLRHSVDEVHCALFSSSIRKAHISYL